jgi:hypothetical protein
LREIIFQTRRRDKKGHRRIVLASGPLQACEEHTPAAPNAKMAHGHRPVCISSQRKCSDFDARRSLVTVIQSYSVAGPNVAAAFGTQNLQAHPRDKNLFLSNNENTYYQNTSKSLPCQDIFVNSSPAVSDLFFW